MVGKNGGARSGAGRKPKAEKYETAINRAEKRIADRLPELIDNMFRLATGVIVQDTDDEGETLIYQKPPDYKANEYLINRILGKPTERQELTGEDGAPLIPLLTPAEKEAAKLAYAAQQAAIVQYRGQGNE